MHYNFRPDGSGIFEVETAWAAPDRPTRPQPSALAVVQDHVAGLTVTMRFPGSAVGTPFPCGLVHTPRSQMAASHIRAGSDWTRSPGNTPGRIFIVTAGWWHASCRDRRDVGRHPRNSWSKHPSSFSGRPGWDRRSPCQSVGKYLRYLMHFLPVSESWLTSETLPAVESGSAASPAATESRSEKTRRSLGEQIAAERHSPTMAARPSTVEI